MRVLRVVLFIAAFVLQLMLMLVLILGSRMAGRCLVHTIRVIITMAAHGFRRSRVRPIGWLRFGCDAEKGRRRPPFNSSSVLQNWRGHGVVALFSGISN